MNTNRLSKTLASALNMQITKEAHAAQIYLSYAAWADSQDFSAVADFLFRHAQEERSHMMKICRFVLQRGAKVQITAIPAPPDSPVSIHNCFEKIFMHEVDNTKAIYKLVKMSFTEEDWATWNFAQWFVKEQIEEEMLVMKILNKIKLAGGEKISHDAMYLLDRDMETNTGEAGSATEIKPV